MVKILRKYWILFFLMIYLLLLAASFVLSESDVPIGLQKIFEYQDDQSKFYLQNLSFIIAFLGGIMSFLLPCTFAILPAFFAYTFKEKKDLTKMTFIFFLGFSLVFSIFGLIAAFVGESISSLQIGNKLFVSIAGIFLIVLGIISLFGKGFSSFIKPQQRFKHDKLGIFLFGVFFAVGWSACIGPILAAIMLIASTFKSYFISVLLLFFYSLGIFLPFFIVSFIYDKYDLSRVSWIKGKELSLGKLKFHSTSLVSGLLLIIAGVVFIIFSGTSIVQQTIVFGTEFIYEFERKMFNIPYLNYIGFLILAVFIFFLIKFLRRKEQD